MGLHAASIVFNDSASRFNKDLTDFLKRNLETAIRRGGMSFHFKIAKPADLSELRKMGVKRLPAMIINSTAFVGVPNIIEEIRKRVKTSQLEAPEKSEEEIIRDFHMKSLDVKKDAEGKFQVNDESEKEDVSTELQSSYNREISRRGASAGHTEDADNKPKRNASRAHEHDMDDEAPQTRPQSQRANTQPPQQARGQQRPNNIDNPMMADAHESLRRVGKTADGDDMQDDAMMEALLNRMGGD
jgi:hypothetical protein